MDSSNRPREGSILPDQSNSSERTPLLAKAPASDTPEADTTAVYVQIINDHLPWHKRPSALWLIPIYGLSSVSSGMLSSSQGLFQAGMLCREYMNRHSSNTTLAAVSYLAEQTSSSVATSGLANMIVSKAADSICETPEVLAFVAKTLALIEVIGGIASKAFSLPPLQPPPVARSSNILLILPFPSFSPFRVLFLAASWEEEGTLSVPCNCCRNMTSLLRCEQRIDHAWLLPFLLY